MSTTILQLNGKIEVPNLEEWKSNYISQEVYFTTFYGGEERGKSLQITLESGEYTQLSNEQVQQLVKALLDAGF